MVNRGLGALQGIGIKTLVLFGPLLRLALAMAHRALGIGQAALIALASRVSPFQGTEIGKAVHQSTHHGCGCCRSPIRAGPTGAIARDRETGDPCSGTYWLSRLSWLD